MRQEYVWMLKSMNGAKSDDWISIKYGIEPTISWHNGETMKIDIQKRTFALANKTGGMSGPAVKPVALRMVYQAARAVKVPVIGMGGISTAEDALEFLLAGASAVSVGTANFYNPYATMEIAEGIVNYMKENGVEEIQELIGAVK